MDVLLLFLFRSVRIAPDKAHFNRKVLIFFLFLHINTYCGTHYKRLAESFLMSTHNICFHGEIRKYSRLSLSRSPRDSLIFLDIRTSACHICKIEEKTNRTNTFNK